MNTLSSVFGENQKNKKKCLNIKDLNLENGERKQKRAFAVCVRLYSALFANRKKLEWKVYNEKSIVSARLHYVCIILFYF